MSPSEDDLRAALHEGDAKDLNVDQLILHARARVAQRRVHLLSGAAITAVVAAIGVGGVLLANSGGDQGSASDAGAPAGTVFGAEHQRAAQASSPDAPVANAPAAGGGVSADSALAVRCPRTPPRYLLPGGGSPGQFGGSEPLFKKPVSSVVVCAYGAATKPLTMGGSAAVYPARLVLRDGAAQSLVTSLESAPKEPTHEKCPYIQSSASTRNFAFIGLTADDRPAGKAVTASTTPGCGGQVTNGTAIRYGWVPPSDLQQRLSVLTPTAAPKSTAAASPTN